MLPLVVYAPTGVPPSGVADLSARNGSSVDRDGLVAAGQALTWQWPFGYGARIAIPLDATTAVVVGDGRGTGMDLWYERFARGLAHRIAGELTIASVSAGLLGETLGSESGEGVGLLGSAIEGLGRVLGDVDDMWNPAKAADQIVSDAVRTHVALLSGPADQRVTVREDGEFTVHTVWSVSAHLARADLERIRTRIGLPWPARTRNGVGPDLGLVRWRATLQAHGGQMWCRLEGENVLVTELWLRAPRSSASPG